MTDTNKRYIKATLIVGSEYHPQIFYTETLVVKDDVHAFDVVDKWQQSLTRVSFEALDHDR